MKKKILLTIGQIMVILLIVISLVYGDERFSPIAGLKEHDYYPPVIIMKPDGGYFAFWMERVKKTDYVEGVPRTLSYDVNFYSVVSSHGEATTVKRELNLLPTIEYQHGIAITANSSMWLDSDKLLIIGWKMTHGLADPPGYRPERIIISSSGEILSGPDTFRGGSSDASLLKDSKGNVYAVWCIPAVGVLQVYPDIKQHKSTYDWASYYKKYPTLGFREPVVTITSEDELLICSRVGWGYTPLEEQGIWDGPFRPDRIFYFLADLEGNLITEPLELNIVENAFRKIAGIHLGGSYSNLESPLDIDKVKVCAEDMDLSTLPNGDIILSVTAPDENGVLDVYQLKFTPEGKLVKPDELQVVNAWSVPEDLILPAVKCRRATVGGGDKWRTELVLFGFDEEGNFYSEREVWKEQVK